MEHFDKNRRGKPTYKKTEVKFKVSKLYLDSNLLGTGSIQINKLRNEWSRIEISLRKNQLTKFPGSDSLPINTTSLDLSDNFLTNADGLDMYPCIDTLRMSNNKLKKVPKLSLKPPQCINFTRSDDHMYLTMDISYNKISSVRMDDFRFDGVKCGTTEFFWKEINLAGNDITDVEGFTLNHTGHEFGTIDISDNNLTVLDYSIIDNDYSCPNSYKRSYSRENELILYDNPINCKSKNILTAVERNSLLQSTSRIELLCYHPQELHGISFHELT